MRQTGLAVGVFAVLAGIFWAGRESTHGLAAFWKHWWCPIPLALILVGVAAVIAVRRTTTN